MDFDELVREVVASGLQIPATKKRWKPSEPEALFHLPLLSVCILLLSEQEGLSTENIGRHTASLLMETFTELQNTAQRIPSSFALRRRCADCLVLLETLALVTVTEGSRAIQLAPDGKAFVRKHLPADTEFGMLVRRLRDASKRLDLKGGMF